MYICSTFFVLDISNSDCCKVVSWNWEIPQVLDNNVLLFPIKMRKFRFRYTAYEYGVVVMILTMLSLIIRYAYLHESVQDRPNFQDRRKLQIRTSTNPNISVSPSMGNFNNNICFCLELYWKLISQNIWCVLVSEENNLMLWTHGTWVTEEWWESVGVSRKLKVTCLIVGHYQYYMNNSPS